MEPLVIDHYTANPDWPDDVLGVCFGGSDTAVEVDGRLVPADPRHLGDAVETLATRVIGPDGVARDFRVTRWVERYDVVRVGDLVEEGA